MLYIKFHCENCLLGKIMTKNVSQLSALFFFFMPLFSSASQQEKHIGTFGKEWKVYEVKQNGQTFSCYMIGRPTQTQLSTPGKKRGQSYFLIATHKEPYEKHIISFAAGYPLKRDSHPHIKLPTKRYELTVAGKGTPQDLAWVGDMALEEAIVSAGKEGKTWEIIGESDQGTQTKDVYDLTGFSAAYTTMMKTCHPQPTYENENENKNKKAKKKVKTPKRPQQKEKKQARITSSSGQKSPGVSVQKKSKKK